MHNHIMHIRHASSAYSHVGGVCLISPPLFSSPQDCTCISTHSQVQSISIEEQYEDISHQVSSSDVSPCSVLTADDDVTGLSTDPAHYQLLSHLGRGFNNLSQNEVLLSRLFRHPNLLTSRLVFTSCCELWVLSPLMSYGSADSLLRAYFPDGMSESLIAYLLYGVLKGLEYLHHMGYVHRGVKASHVLLSAEGRVCLSGLQSVYSLMKDGKRTRVVYDMPQHSPSLLPWLSPELLRQDLNGYGVKSDIYSLGILACELVTGRVPFQDMPPTLMLLQKLRGSHSCLLDISPYPLGDLGALKVSRSGVDSGIGESVATGSLTRTATAERPQSPGPKNHSATLHNLVELCLQQQPDSRPSASALRTHPFFRQVKKHTRDSFLSLMYPAVPMSCPPDTPPSETPTKTCNSPSPTNEPEDEMWDFS
ncbi:STE20-related kinase adapter protein beta isoform X3 [Triplophysa dalaica]|uniref:STE20-related kinase adapter protein beta isoform X3 n=1 Tax=Triplophysa dalaica TaxID=1582913 RepID=UPI0024DF74B1|nr:STE20-related kinase adapter protein beta isoform X3 [Triplophysa dalaica]